MGRRRSGRAGGQAVRAAPRVRKVDLRAIEAIRRLQENPNLGAFRVHAALKQMGIELSRATCGRIMALNRKLYGLKKPKGGGGEKKPMPFAASRRHEYWSADVRYVDEVQERFGGKVYVISILENYSRAILASAITRSQDLSTFLSVLYLAVERYGSPETLVTDGGSIVRAHRAKAIYEVLNINKEEIERGKPWQNYIETTLTVPIECPSISFHLRRVASGGRRSVRGRRRRDGCGSWDVARWRGPRSL
jgi:putative transposase